jgi:peptidoglycan/LPS O-acetylase OafA/YrhL
LFSFFFVLSGFVIHLNFSKRFRYSNAIFLEYSRYIWKRAKRIYPPFIFALIITFVLDKCGILLGYQSDSVISAPQRVATVTHYLDFKTLTFNLLFLYYTYSPLFGSNGPTWSLKFEWWFYMVYPFLMLISKKNIFWATGCLFVSFFLTFFPYLWPEQLSREIFMLMLSWWWGVLLAEIYIGRINLSLRLVSISMMLFFALPLFANLNSALYFNILSLAFAGLIAFCLTLKEGNLGIKIISRLKIFGDFSFTVYIIHYPIFLFIRGWWQSTHSGLLPKHFGLVSLAILGVTIFAYLVHFITEVPFMSKKHREASFLKSIAGNTSH